MFLTLVSNACEIAARVLQMVHSAGMIDKTTPE
jgi:hypothetical protein